MAKFIAGTGISEIRGKLGGIVFSRCNTGPFIRSRVTPIQPATTAQLKTRSTFQNITATWSQLSQEQFQAWRSCSALAYMTCGRTIRLSGMQLFMFVNKNLIAFGLPTLTLPPADFTSPSLFTSLEIMSSADSGVGDMPKIIDVDWTNTAWNENLYVVVYASQKMRSGRGSPWGRFRYIHNKRFNTGPPIRIAVRYRDIYGAMGTADIGFAKIFYRIAMFNAANGMMTRGVAGWCVYGEDRKLM